MPPKQRAKEEKKIKSAQRKKQTRAETRDYLRGMGLPDQFITRNRLNDRQVKSYTTDELLRLRKQSELERAGITNYLKGDLRLGWKKLQEKYPSISIPENAWENATKLPAGAKRAQEFLYIGAAEVRGGFTVEDFSSWTVKELKDHINARIKEAKDDPDSSGSLYCVFKVYSGTESEMNYIANVYYKRGYDLNPDHMKLESGQYQKLTINDTWTSNRFLSMVYNVINQMKNEEVGDFITEMKGYCNRNALPYMKGIK